MYEGHFGLTKNPFSMTPDAKALFLTPAHREALAGLSYAVLRRKGFAVLIGEAGTGKTTLIQSLVAMAGELKAQFSVVLNPTLSASEFLELLLHNFGMRDLPASKAQRLIRLEQLLQDSKKAGRCPVLIVDEAHRLKFEVLEEIRLLTNFETSDQKLLQIVMAGQPELNDVLKLPELWQLKQRIAIRLNTEALSAEQVKQYMAHRWTLVGKASNFPFTSEAIAAIALYSRRIPRLINSICDNALLLAFSANAPAVTQAHIFDVARDLDLTPPPVPEKPPVLPAVEIPSRAASSDLPADSNVMQSYMVELSRPSLIQRWAAKLRS